MYVYAKTKSVLLIALALVIVLQAAAQQQKEYVEKTFRSNSLLTLQTVENVPAKSWQLIVQHRFGRADVKKDFLYEFLGMDKTSNIRLGVAIPVTERGYIGAGRTKNNKAVDIEAKYILVKQTSDFRQPVSMALYANAAYNTVRFPENNNGYFEQDSVTAFRYANVHRLSYGYQLLVASKIAPWLSLQLSPTCVYKNLVPPGRDNYSLALNLGGKITVSLMTSVLFEYAVIANKAASQVNPFALGYEIKTASHGFQIFFGSANAILNQELYTTESNADLLDKNFFLAFNIHRSFYIKK
ncbi:MAG: hypothetical protein HC896_05240 [Bacteroidales bacterium]|nr:hypothetical protein [Bacteroidales bacterium]